MIQLFFETASQQEIRDRMHDEVFVTRVEIAVGNLRILSGKEVCHIFSQHGFQEKRQGGSHVIMQEKTGNSTITIPVPNHKEVKPGRLKSINWQSQLPTKDFES
jgi:Predicted periplasmic or secreted lipoprotein